MLERGSHGIPDAEAIFGNAGAALSHLGRSASDVFFFFSLLTQSPFHELLSFYDEDGASST